MTLPSMKVARLLFEVRKENIQRLRMLNRLASGEMKIEAEVREAVTVAEQAIRRELNELLNGEHGLKVISRIVPLEKVGEDRIPKDLTEAYELLACQAYGSEASPSIGDAAVDRNVGKRVARIKTSQTATNGGAKVSTKKHGSAIRHVVRDRRAYELKRNIDRRLIRIARDIRYGLSGVEPESVQYVCERCARIGQEEWRFCPSCGAMIKHKERA